MKTYNPELVPMFQNSSISISLTGWPATVSVLAVCAASVGIYALNVVTQTRPDEKPFSYLETNAA